VEKLRLIAEESSNGNPQMEGTWNGVEPLDALKM
jgi:hypothetical protein